MKTWNPGQIQDRNWTESEQVDVKWINAKRNAQILFLYFQSVSDILANILFRQVGGSTNSWYQVSKKALNENV